MPNLQYKTFVWPQNPSTYSQRILRTPVYFQKDDGTVLFAGLSGVKRSITGSGVFTGTSAVSKYQELEALALIPTSGKLTHPTLGELTCYFTQLKMTQEPENNVIHYEFTFTQADGDDAIPQ